MYEKYNTQNPKIKIVEKRLIHFLLKGQRDP
jgi:hypothetical protein